jgi:hypothetical protein
MQKVQRNQIIGLVRTKKRRKKVGGIAASKRVKPGVIAKDQQVRRMNKSRPLMSSYL